MQLRIVAAAAAVITLSAAPAAHAQESTSGTLSVTGQGSVKVTPDRASLSLSVTRTAPRAAPALSAANRRVDAIERAARGAGVPRSGIETGSVATSCAAVRVGPKHHRHRIRRCTARESLTIRSAAAIVGHVIDAATHAGANRIDGPDFSFSTPSAGVLAAERAAIRNARRRAGAAAAQLGDTVTGVRSIDLDPGSDEAPPRVNTPVPAPPAPPRVVNPTPTSIHPTAQEVDATVAVVFAIAPQ